MCSVANLFDTSMRKCDAKNIIFFALNECVNDYQKLIFFKNKISVIKIGNKLLLLQWRIDLYKISVLEAEL